jgi:hypothetical protein
VGSIKIDIYKKEREFQQYDYTYNSKEDFYRLLFRIDYIYLESLKGNYEALCLIEDFCSIVKTKLLSDFIKISCGIIKSDPNKDIFECIAIYNNITIDNCKKILDKEIEQTIQSKRQLWSYNVKINLNNKEKNNKKRYSYTTKIDNETYNKLDYKQKYDRFNINYNENYPEDLKEVIHTYNSIQNRIKHLPTGKEKNKLINILKSYYNDIIDLKKHYNLKIDYMKSPTKKSSTTYSLQEWDLKDEDNTYRDVCFIDYIDKIVADNCTEKQQKIYYMYFKLKMTQKEIGEILDIGQPRVSKHINSISNNIKNNY